METLQNLSKELIKYLPRKIRQNIELGISDQRLEEILNQHEDKINELSKLTNNYESKIKAYEELLPIRRRLKIPPEDRCDKPPEDRCDKWDLRAIIYDIFSIGSISGPIGFYLGTIVQGSNFGPMATGALFSFLLIYVCLAAYGGVACCTQDKDKYSISINPLRLPIAGGLAAKRGIQKANHWRLKYKIKNQKEKLAKTIAKDYANNNLIWEAIEAYKKRSDLINLLNQLNETDRKIAVSYIDERAEREINTASVEETLEIRNFLIKNNVRNAEVDKVYAKKFIHEIPDRFNNKDKTIISLIDELKDNSRKYETALKILNLEIKKGFTKLRDPIGQKDEFEEYLGYCESIGYGKEVVEFRQKFVKASLTATSCPLGEKIKKTLSKEEYTALPLDLTLEEWIGKRRFLSREDIRTAGRETSPDGCYITLQHGFELLLNKADELPEQEMPYLHEYIESVVIPEIELGLKKHDGVFSKKYSRNILITYMDQFRELARQTKIFKLESEPAISYKPKKGTIEELLPEPPKKIKIKTEQAEGEGAILQ